jgi:hypothetical protein
VRLAAVSEAPVGYLIPALFLLVPCPLIVWLLQWSGRRTVASVTLLLIVVSFTFFGLGFHGGEEVGKDGLPLPLWERLTYRTLGAAGVSDLIAFGALLFVALSPSRESAPRPRPNRR